MIIDFSLNPRLFIAENLPGVRNPVSSPDMCSHKIDPTEWSTKTNATAQNIVVHIGLSLLTMVHSQNKASKTVVSTSLPTGWAKLNGVTHTVYVTVNLAGLNRFFKINFTSI